MESRGSHPTREEGLRLIKAGDYRAAISVLDQVVDADPSDAQAFLFLGVASAETGNKAEAIAAFEQSVSLQSSARGHYNLGLAYESVDRLGEAMTQFQYATRMDNTYKPALDSVDRLKQQGIVAMESTTQWTIGAQSVAEAIAEKQAQVASQAEQTTAFPPGFSPDGMQGQTGAPRPYLPGEYEAIQEAKLHEHQMQLTKSGLLYGILVGPVGLMGGMFLFRMFLGGAMFNLILILFAGMFVGAILGAICGYTGGGEETGERVGAGMFALFFLISGIVGGIGAIFLCLNVLVGGGLGFVTGMFIGRMVDASIGWD